MTNDLRIGIATKSFVSRENDPCQLKRSAATCRTAGGKVYAIITRDIVDMVDIISG